MARAIRARSCSMEVSLSSKRGGSWAARRATEFFAMSQAICTWRVSATCPAPAARRAARRVELADCVAWASPFSPRIRERLPPPGCSRTPPPRARASRFSCVFPFVWLASRRRAPRRRTADAAYRPGPFYSPVRLRRQVSSPGTGVPGFQGNNTESSDGIEAIHEPDLGPRRNWRCWPRWWTSTVLGRRAGAGASRRPRSARVADLEKTLGVPRARAHHAAHFAHFRRASAVPARQARRARKPTPRAARREAAVTRGQGAARGADPTYGRVLLAPLVPRFLEAFAHVP